MESATASVVQTNSPRRPFQSLYWRLSGVFLALLLAVSAIFASIFYFKFRTIGVVGDQLLDWEFAKLLVPKIEPHVAGSIDFQGLEEEIFEIRSYKPNATVYVLDASGAIRAYLGEIHRLKHPQVPIEPIERFLRGSNQSLPILAPDPEQDDDQIIFSAAPIRIGAGNGYLFVSLTSQQRKFTGAALELDRALLTLGVLFVLGIAATGATGLFAFSKLTRRLNQLTTSVRRFREGSRSEQFRVGGDDEIGELGEAFDQMAQDIAESIEKLKQNDQLRRQFVANISHDLRGPLTSITGFLETIRASEGALDEQAIRTCHNIIFRSAESLNRMVGELFELARLDARESPAQIGPHRIEEVLEDLSRRYQVIAGQAGITLIVAADNELPQLLFDPLLIERSLANLLDNALRYCPPGGTITLGAHRRDAGVAVSIRDTGSGIPADKVDEIFNRFFQADLKRSSAGHGAGLGLAIVKKIIEAHGSTIQVDSTVGVGTCFSFILKPSLPKLEA